MRDYMDRRLPYLHGVPHLHVNRPSILQNYNINVSIKELKCQELFLFI